MPLAASTNRAGELLANGEAYLGVGAQGPSGPLALLEHAAPLLPRALLLLDLADLAEGLLELGFRSGQLQAHQLRHLALREARADGLVGVERDRARALAGARAGPAREHRPRVGVSRQRDSRARRPLEGARRPAEDPGGVGRDRSPPDAGLGHGQRVVGAVRELEAPDPGPPVVGAGGCVVLAREPEGAEVDG